MQFRAPVRIQLENDPQFQRVINSVTEQPNYDVTGQDCMSTENGTRVR